MLATFAAKPTATLACWVAAAHHSFPRLQPDQTRSSHCRQVLFNPALSVCNSCVTPQSCREAPPKPFHAFLQPSVQSTATQRSSSSSTPRQALMSGFVSTPKSTSPWFLSPAGAMPAIQGAAASSQQASDAHASPSPLQASAHPSGMATPTGYSPCLVGDAPAITTLMLMLLQGCFRGGVLYCCIPVDSQLLPMLPPLQYTPLPLPTPFLLPILLGRAVTNIYYRIHDCLNTAPDELGML